MKDDKVYLIHILESIENIQKYNINGKKEFMEFSIIQDATIRNLEIIGEDTKKLSEDLRGDYPQLPFRKMAGLRDILIHNYFGIDLTIIWNVIENELPQIKVELEKILSSRI